MKSERQHEHEWLQKFVGEWTFDAECIIGPGQAPIRSSGTESVRSFGDQWVHGEGRSQMPDGSPALSLLTLGFDPQKKAFIGTWVTSVMSHLWVYEGHLDSNRRVLTLNTSGPGMVEGTTAVYQDVFAFDTDDHRILSSQFKGDDGAWQRFMTSHYRRSG